MKRIALVTSGGDCPGLNPCIRAVVRTAAARGIEVLGVHRGWRGLIDDDIHAMDRRDVSGIIRLGGTILRSSRCPEFHEPGPRARAAENLVRRGVEGFITIGGDGSLAGAWALSQETHIPIVGVPKTIDNDVGGTEYALGFDTAINTAVDAIDKIRDTATSHDRVALAEVMGRHRGFLALEVGIASGAEAVLLPETPTDVAALCERLDKGRASGKVSSIIVVAEGDDAGNAYAVAERIREISTYRPSVSVLGYIQRGGTPSARDRVLGSRFGQLAVSALLDGANGKMVALSSDTGRVDIVDLERSWSEERPLDPEMLELARVLAM